MRPLFLDDISVPDTCKGLIMLVNLPFFYHTESQLAQTIAHFITDSIMDVTGRYFTFPCASLFLLILLMFMFLTKKTKITKHKNNCAFFL